MDCGVACLAMLADRYGKRYPIEYLRNECFLTCAGVSLLGITEAAQKIGFDCISAKISIDEFETKELPLPCILHWSQNHFVVLQKITRNKYKIVDPAHGFVSLSKEKFCQSWLSDSEKGVAMFLTPTKVFYEQNPP
jgi:ATP-binding cassette subfamily B protein